jgi:hypothetical protein
MNLIRQLTLAFILSVGFSGFCGLIGSWASEQVRHALRRNDPYQGLVLKGDGTPIVVADRLVRDPDERPKPPSPDEVWLDTTYLAADESRLYPSLFDDWHWRLRQFTDTRFPGIVWYFVSEAQEHGAAYFAGYESKTKECIGYLGTAGFRTEPLPAGELFPFQGSGRGSIHRLHALNAVPWGQYVPIGAPAPRDMEMPWHVFVQGDNDTIYAVDLAERTVNVALKKPEIRSSAILLRSHPPGAAGRRDLVVRTADAVVVLNGKTNEPRRFVIPPDLRNISFSWGETTTGEGLAVWNDPLLPDTDVFAHHVAWMDAAGNVVRRSDVDVPVSPSPNEERWMLGLSVPTPLYVDVFVGILMPYWVYGARESFGAAVIRSAAEYWPSLLYVHILSAILAGLCYRRQVLNEASRAERVVWPLFVFLLGLPGWIGYRCTFPSRAAEFPTPELRGTEVFA